jgi:hypothetical protein
MLVAFPFCPDEKRRRSISADRRGPDLQAVRVAADVRGRAITDAEITASLGEILAGGLRRRSPPVARGDHVTSRLRGLRSRLGLRFPRRRLGRRLRLRHRCGIVDGSSSLLSAARLVPPALRRQARSRRRRPRRSGWVSGRRFDVDAGELLGPDDLQYPKRRWGG